MKAFEHCILDYQLGCSDKQLIRQHDWVRLLKVSIFPEWINWCFLKNQKIFSCFLGVYTYLFEKFSNPDGSPPGFFKKAGLGMSAGACGAFVGTPAEISLIRMTSDGNLPAAERR